MSDRTHFTAEEAEALLGRRYRATAPYAGVPAGTVGRVYGSYEVNDGLRGFDVVWELPPSGSPADSAAGGRTDGFSRDDLYLVFTARPTRRAAGDDPTGRCRWRPGRWCPVTPTITADSYVPSARHGVPGPGLSHPLGILIRMTSRRSTR